MLRSLLLITDCEVSRHTETPEGNSKEERRGKGEERAGRKNVVKSVRGATVGGPSTRDQSIISTIDYRTLTLGGSEYGQCRDLEVVHNLKSIDICRIR